MNKTEKIIAIVCTIIILIIGYIIFNSDTKTNNQVLNIDKNENSTLNINNSSNNSYYTEDFSEENVDNQDESSVSNQQKENDELHVVSVYEASSDSHRTPSEINVTVTVKKPITLLLNSYEPIIWNINLEDGAKINQIYLSSHYDSEVNIHQEDVFITKQKYVELTEANFDKVQEIIQLTPKTYQYEYQQRYFLVDGKRGLKYNKMPTHLQTNEDVKLQCEEYSCKIYNDTQVGYSNSGASSMAVTNRYYKKGSGKYYFEAELIVPKLNNKIVKQKLGKIEKIYDTPYVNIGILSAWSKEEHCSFHSPNSNGRCYSYSPISWCEQLLPNKNGKIIVGIAVDFDRGTMYAKKNFESDWETYSFKNDGREYTAAFEIASDLRWNVNLGDKKFSYKPPKGFKPYNSPLK